MSPQSRLWLGRLLFLGLALLTTFGAARVLKHAELPFWGPALWSPANVTPLLHYGLLWLGVLLLRSVRWLCLLPVQQRRHSIVATLTALVGHGALCVLPFRLGELVRPTLWSRFTRAPLAQVAATVFAERLLDGVALSAALLGALCVTRPAASTVSKFGVSYEALRHSAVLASGGFLLLLLLLLWARQARVWLEQRLQRHVRGRWPELTSRVSAILRELGEGLAFLGSGGRLAAFLLLTAGYWSLNALALQTLLHDVGFESAQFAQAVVAMGIVGLGLLAPTVPGFLGAFQLSLYVALAVCFGAAGATPQATRLVTLAHAVQVGLTATIGLVSVLPLSWVFARRQTPSEPSRICLARGVPTAT